MYADLVVSPKDVKLLRMYLCLYVYVCMYVYVHYVYVCMYVCTNRDYNAMLIDAPGAQHLQDRSDVMLILSQSLH